MFKYSTVKDFEALPPEVQKEIFAHLGGYSQVSVYYEYGRYSYLNGACLKSHYAPDHRSWDFRAADLRKAYPDEIAAAELEFKKATENFDWSQL